MNNDRLNPQPSWVTDVYMPEGADRPSHNPPVTHSDQDLSSEKPATVAEVRSAYQATVNEVIEEWRNMLASCGVSYEVVTTDESFGVPLRRAFAARQRLP